MFKLFKQKSKSIQTPLNKQEILAKKSIQDLIPIKDVEDGLLITPDNIMVQVLKVSAINLELASNSECNELFEQLENFLIGLTFPVQVTILSMPINLNSYISEQKKIYHAETNPYKRMLQESYIEYTEDIELSQDIMQRQRYIKFAEQLKENTPEARYDTRLEFDEKKEEIIAALAELELTVEPVRDLEIVRYIHTLFDYEGAQNLPIQDLSISEIVKGGNADEITI